MIADILVLILLAGGALFGFRRGFVRAFVGTFSIVISLVLALLLYPVVSGWLEDSNLPGYVSSYVAQMMGEQADPSAEADDAQATEPPEDVLGLPSNIGESIAKGADAAMDAVTNGIAASVSELAVNLLAILVVFLIVRVGLAVVTALLDGLFQLPVLSLVNRLAGGVFGLASGLLITYVLLGLLTFVATTGHMAWAVDEVRSSTVASQLYDNNLITQFVFRSEPERIA